ncbi:MAG: hypothetical protein WEA82_00005 [Idiomarina sp.]
MSNREEKKEHSKDNSADLKALINEMRHIRQVLNLGIFSIVLMLVAFMFLIINTFG